MIEFNFAENHLQYDNFSIWHTSGLDEFMECHELMHEVFINEYNMLYKDRHEIPESDFAIMTILLSYFKDKYFVVFCNNDSNHQNLKTLKENNLIQIDLDISLLENSKYYILEMTKVN